MTNKIYTAITFNPVDIAIGKYQKLRDLYVSVYLLSYLSWVICQEAEKRSCKVIIPALQNIIQGMPNQIIIEGDFSEEDARLALLTGWECVTETCREWIEENIKGEWEYTSWAKNWRFWTKYAWEFFWVQGKNGQSISEVREKLNEKKRCRDWTGINWQGESSSLSSIDAIAYPKLGQISDPRNYNYHKEKKDVTDFYKALSEKLGESLIKSARLQVSYKYMRERCQQYGKIFISPGEELSIPELIKRLITHKAIIDKLNKRLEELFGKNGVILKNFTQQINQLSYDINLTTFSSLNRLNKDKFIHENTQQEKFWTCWFQGNADQTGKYLKSFAHRPEEAQQIHKFSQEMREWGHYFQELPKNKRIANCRVISCGYDFLGVFYNRKNADDCVKFFSRFKADTWNEGKTQLEEKKKNTVSVGFVWAPSSIPQWDVLQHCRLAEKSAKSNGRDRIALRILFKNGNHLEWVCPWWLLEVGLLSSYRDRDKNESNPKQNWTHIYNDIGILESRRAFDGRGLDIALGLLHIYFPKHVAVITDENKWLHASGADLTKTDSGILGYREMYYKDNSKEIDETKVSKDLTNWIINLAKVGFHLCQQ